MLILVILCPSASSRHKRCRKEGNVSRPAGSGRHCGDKGRRQDPSRHSSDHYSGVQGKQCFVEHTESVRIVERLL